MKRYAIVFAAVAMMAAGCNQENATDAASKTSTSGPSTTTTAGAPPATDINSFCRIKLVSKTCVHPGRFDADGIFEKDTHNGSNTNAKVCLNRAREYAVWCKTDQPVIAEFVKDGQVADSTTFTKAQ